MIDEINLAKGAMAVCKKCKSGQRLCKSFRSNSKGGAEILYLLEPSGERVGQKSALAAISSGVLTPLLDGLFGESQTWMA